MPNEWMKMFDPKKIVESYYGDLGSVFGNPFGLYGDFNEFSPQAYFKMNEFYNGNDYYDSKTIIRDAIS